jgi:hypothetical protein
MVADQGSQEEYLLPFTWSISDFTPRKVSLSLNFDTPLDVSASESHYLRVKFLQNGYFVDSRTNKPIDLNYTITAPVPKQLLQDAASRFLGQHAQTIKTSLQTSLQTNFLANIFL